MVATDDPGASDGVCGLCASDKIRMCDRRLLHPTNVLDVIGMAIRINRASWNKDLAAVEGAQFSMVAFSDGIAVR
jgi:hypothetical protein